MLFKSALSNQEQVNNIVSKNNLSTQNRRHVLILSLDTFGTRKTANDR